MHAGRLHNVIKTIYKDFIDLKIINLVSEILEYHRSISIKSNPKINLILVLKLRILEKILLDCPSNKFTPTKKNILKQMKASHLVGKGLWDEINNFVSNRFSSFEYYLSESEKIRVSLEVFFKNIQSTINGFESLFIDSVDLDEYESEVGISIPSKFISPTLENLEKETHKLITVFRTFSEVVEADYSEIKIRTLSTSDIQLFINCAFPVAAAIAVAIERIVKLYKNSLEIKKLRRELSKHSIPEDIIDSIKEHIKKNLTFELRQIAEEIVEKNVQIHDSERSHELKTATYNSLKYIASRFENGAIIEATIGQPVKQDKKKTKKTKEVESTLVSYEERDINLLNEAGRSFQELDEYPEDVKLLTNDNDINA